MTNAADAPDESTAPRRRRARAVLLGPSNDEVTRRAELASAAYSGALHLFAAVAVPMVLWDVDAVERGLLVAWGCLEALLGLVSVVALSQGRRHRLASFRMLSQIESLGSATSFAALAWLGPRLATETPSKYILTVTLVALTSISAANSALVAHRRTNFLRSLTVIGLAHFVAYAVHGEVLLATFTVLWCVAILLVSRVGYQAMLELQELRAASDEVARHDDLTGLLDRSAFMAAVDDMAPHTDEWVLVLIDLDGFKAINDGFGHSAGDEVLRVVADRMSEVLPDDAVLGRLGGDEFAAVIPLARIDLRLSLDRLLERIGEPVVIDGLELYVAGSAGWTHLSSNASAVEHMMQADAAMYRSKSSSSESSTGFSAKMQQSLDRSLALRLMFRNAVKQRRIDFLAQPLVRANDGFPVAVELLARWPADDGDETIGPDEFNRLADETGLAVELDRLALGAARDLLEAWRHDAYLESVVVKANISPLHLNNLVLARSIRDLIPEGDRRRLGIEFVESKLITAGQHHTAFLHDLRSMGVTISIDDFGVGYSALSYLRELPAAEIKLDRSFVTGIDRDPINQGVVRAIVEIATTLGLSTVAEGVETDAELEKVRQLGLDTVQGFLTGRPLPLDEVGEHLRSQRLEVRSSGDRGIG